MDGCDDGGDGVAIVVVGDAAAARLQLCEVGREDLQEGCENVQNGSKPPAAHHGAPTV